ncbi:hypothetical protein HY224_02375, partial [Candidatus Uhrbacteria bacterium]|nr:hypothetical protein [Candidatus Uhrbacteria bacterium]
AQLLSSDISRKATENRYLLTEIAWDAFKHHPWIGNGAGRYMGIVAINRDYIKTFGQPLDSHGFLQKLMAEEGTLGLVTFLAFLGYVLKRIWSRLKDKTLSPDARKVVLASLIAVSGGIIFQLFNTSYYVSKLWLPIGVALVVMRLIEKKEIV